ncbi:MAG: NUDIX domain-containing protein [Acidobacteriota bacterium]|nr:NUDIX domain-containing protein [Acidobacteriota bacterium]
MSGVDALAAALAALDPVDERESASVAATLDRLTWPGDPFDESANEHHLTASAFVVSSRGVILLRHRILGIWVQPGGHVDAGEDPLSAARRETLEETGLATTPLDPAGPYQVDVHPGPRGHTHYDLRYLLAAAPEDPRPGPGESPEVAWFDFAAALGRCEPTLVAVLGRLAREMGAGRWETVA